MSLLGIDVGTTGCKAVLFTEDGEILSSAYSEYDIHVPQSGWAELDSENVWTKVKNTVGNTLAQCPKRDVDSLVALSISSLGEAFVPVTSDRRILGPSLLNFDARGAEYLDTLGQTLTNEHLYSVNGNTLGNHYGLPKLMWLKDHRPDLYEQADKFLLWGSFVSYMLGSEPIVDYSLANRTLFFNLSSESWSEQILDVAGIDRDKLPDTQASGTVIGTVSTALAEELGMPKDVKIVSGAHDQCANAVGCGVIEEGLAMFGMGTYVCIVPVFVERKETALMLSLGLNTEHHAVPNKYVSFIYNAGGVIFKWFRDTFAAEDRLRAESEGKNIYSTLISEMPDDPSSVLVLPHFTVTGPPEFVSDSCGIVAGLKLETKRGDILKGILEGVTYYLLECLESLPETGITIENYRAVGGGSNSDEWIQLSADIINRPFYRPRITEAGALGAAVLAGKGSGCFNSLADGVNAMVKIEKEFHPDQNRHRQYLENYKKYLTMWPQLSTFLRNVASA